MLLQEVRCTDKQFPHEALRSLGYYVKVLGQKSYNGVAILSKYPLDNNFIELEGCITSGQDARYVESDIIINKINHKVISVYIPNGYEVGSQRFVNKIVFFHKLRQRLIYLLKYEENIIIGGDFNVAPEMIDVYNPKGCVGKLLFNVEERISFRRLLNIGLIDTFREFNTEIQQFSWWDYRAGCWEHNKGMRIDHILVSPSVADRIFKCGVLDEVRGWSKPSDHAPIYINIK